MSAEPAATSGVLLGGLCCLFSNLVVTNESSNKYIH